MGSVVRQNLVFTLAALVLGAGWLVRSAGASERAVSATVVALGLAAYVANALYRRASASRAGSLRGPDATRAEPRPEDSLGPAVRPLLDAVGEAARALTEGPAEVTLFVAPQRLITGALEYRYSIDASPASALASPDSVRLRRAIEALGAQVAKTTQRDPAPAHIVVTIAPDAPVRVHMRVD